MISTQTVLAVFWLSSAAVKPAGVFGDHMVLQRGMNVPVWGTADPGEPVTVTFAGQKVTATTNADGKWRATLAPLTSGGPHELTVNNITFTDVLVGEVWLCSGQSNMTMALQKGLPYSWNDVGVVNYQAEIEAADYPTIRLTTVRGQRTVEPLENINVDWYPCTPANVKGFSAVAYFYGRELHRELDVPIGLIHSSYGGTLIMPWTPPEGFAAVPALANVVDEIKQTDETYRQTVTDAIAQHEAWLARAKAAAASGDEVKQPPRWPQHPRLSHGPCGLYNAMIHPLIPFALRGAIWYQGESNALQGDGILYYHKMHALVRGWRDAWGMGDFPFYYAQLAPFGSRYQGDQLAELREAQRKALDIPNTGMVVTTDIGDLVHIHTPNKQDVGKRLALWALANTYGRDGIVFSGPLLKTVTREGTALRLTFDHVGAGLASRDGKPLTHFQIAGGDGQWHVAHARIDGTTLLVSAANVDAPISVRFCWDQKADPNFINAAGLPASPFSQSVDSQD